MLDKIKEEISVLQLAKIAGVRERKNACFEL